MVEENPQEHKKNPLAFKSLLGLAAAMISFGQFNDTKELLGGIYENITTNFTHQTQYEKLDNLTIGRTISYVEKAFGPPEVVKSSRELNGLVFQYYNIEKAVVAIMNHAGRVAGFVVIPTEDDFTPQMPYGPHKLGEATLASTIEEAGDYFFDANNLIYFSETKDLGKKYLFLQQVIGFVEYGKLQVEVNNKPVEPQQSLEKIREINNFFIQDNLESMGEAIDKFRKSEAANFYAYTELDSALVAESLLTRFEFNTYFGRIND